MTLKMISKFYNSNNARLKVWGRFLKEISFVKKNATVKAVI